MESDSENTLVINDLLSFISCKLSVFPRKKLASVVKEFYPKDEIIQAHNTLLECLPKVLCSKFKHSDPLQGIFTLLSNVPEETSPIFVCQNINNVPQMKSVPSTKVQHVFPDMNLSAQDQQELQDEHSNLRVQITEVSSVVSQLKDQMELLIKKYKSYDPNAQPLPKKKVMKKQKAAPIQVKIEPKTPAKAKQLLTLQPDLDEEMYEETIEEEITGALIDTTRIRAQRKQPTVQIGSLNGTLSPKGKLLKKRKFSSDDPEEGIILTAESDEEDYDLNEMEDSIDEDLDEEEEMEDVKDPNMKECFIALGRCDSDEPELENRIVIKKEPVELEEVIKTSSGRPVRQKFSKFSEDYVVDFGSRSAKKPRK